MQGIRYMKSSLLALIPGAVMLVGLGCSPIDAQSAAVQASFLDAFESQWIEDDYWFDGTAEVNIYQASLVKYGQRRQADEVAHILVTEDHDPELLVKADDWRRPGLAGMLKFNYVTSVRTGIYRYQQMLSFFFDRRDMHLAKMTLASHEWCGNSFKELINFDGRSSYDFNTYWDGQGNGSFDVEFPSDLVAYESLPAQLRPLSWRAGLEADLHLLPSQLSSKVSEPRWSTARLTVGQPERVEVVAGDFDAWPVTLRHAGGEDKLWFETDAPHRMLIWQTASGDFFELEKSKKLAYWQLTGPGGERYLED